MHFFFLVQAYRGRKSCTSLLEIVSFHVPTGHVRDFSIFSVSPSNKHCPPRCAYAAKAVVKDLDILLILMFMCCVVFSYYVLCIFFLILFLFTFSKFMCFFSHVWHCAVSVIIIFAQ
jgi:hypothetical protein